MKLKTLIAAGEAVDVYKCDDLAVKVFKEGFTKVNVLYEAINHARIEETGLPVPSLREVTVIDGKWAIAYDYIEGKTLTEIIKEDPANLNKYIEQMLDLQLEIHSKRSPYLVKLKDRYKMQIQSLPCIDENRKYELLTRLDGMPKHTKVCHGNFDPNNIIINGDKIYLLDWVAASQGNASADIATTYLLLSLNNKDAAEFYMDRFCEKTGTAKKYVQEWLPIVAAAQLAKNIETEKDLLMKWIDVIEYQ